MVEIRRSSWCMVQLVNKKDVTDLLRQEIVYDPYKKILISFRPIVCKPPRRESFWDLQHQLKEKPHRTRGGPHSRRTCSDRKISTLRGVENYERYPVVWKMKAPNPEWVIPKKIKLKKKSVSIKMAQMCNICHADDHSNWYCQWPKLFPDLLKKPPTTTPLRK